MTTTTTVQLDLTPEYAGHWQVTISRHWHIKDPQIDWGELGPLSVQILHTFWFLRDKIKRSDGRQIVVHEKDVQTGLEFRYGCAPPAEVVAQCLDGLNVLGEGITACQI